jgi:hypothetical protein
MSILALKVEVVIPELGQRGYSLFVETTPDDNYWTIACSNCAVVTVPQKKMLIARSYTDGRGLDAAGMKEVFTRAGLGTE